MNENNNFMIPEFQDLDSGRGDESDDGTGFRSTLKPSPGKKTVVDKGTKRRSPLELEGSSAPVDTEDNIFPPRPDPFKDLDLYLDHETEAAQNKTLRPLMGGEP
jgi:hypothetical protein